MAAYDILFADPGGEHYYSAGVGAAGVWTGGANAPSLVNNAPSGRYTQYAITFSSQPHSVARNFPNYQSWCVGHAFYISSLNTNPLVQFLDNGTLQCDLRINTSGALGFTRNAVQIGGNSSNLLVPGSWHYIEVKAVIASGTSGSMEVRVDGVVWLTVTGVSTQTSTNAFANEVRFMGTSSTSYLKDIYIMADTGTGPNTTYLGDITVAVFYPNGAGVNSAWTPNGAASDYLCAKDNPATGTAPDGDTTYISSATAGQIADFTKAALSLTGSIFAVMVVSYMRKDDAGSRSAANTLLSGGTESDGATQSLGNTYQYYFDVYEKDPHTAAAWTLTGFNNATFGCKLIS